MFLNHVKTILSKAQPTFIEKLRFSGQNYLVYIYFAL